jgi:hypothetical protein
MKEYDPEWGYASWSGSANATIDSERMLSAVKVPVLFTHHARPVDEMTGHLMGAISDLQADRVKELITATGQSLEYRSFPTMGHSCIRSTLARTCRRCGTGRPGCRRRRLAARHAPRPPGRQSLLGPDGAARAATVGRRSAVRPARRRRPSGPGRRTRCASSGGLPLATVLERVGLTGTEVLPVRRNLAITRGAGRGPRRR